MSRWPGASRGCAVSAALTRTRSRLGSRKGGGSGRAYAAAFGRPAARDWPGTGVPVPEMAEDLVEQVARVRAEYAALPGPGELRAMEAAILARPDMRSASAARLRTLIAAAVDLAEQTDELVERLDELPAADRT